MKKILFLLALVAGSLAGYSQGTAVPAATAKADAVAAPRTDVAIAAFVAQSFDFGKIKQGTPVTHEFKFTNTGVVPMIITNVQASCGCTTPAWTKEPIAPGGEGFIKATYNAAALGAFNKSVTVTANVENGFVQLSIKGEVQTSQPNN